MITLGFSSLNLLVCVILVGFIFPKITFAKSSENYDKCILNYIGSVKDRYALAAIKKSCFNLHYRPVKIPSEIINSGVQVTLKLVDGITDGYPVGAKDWHEVFVVNNTKYRLTSIKLEFFRIGQKKEVEIMNHPFAGIGDIDYLHVRPFSSRSNYFIDLRNVDPEIRFRIVGVLGISEE
jgi:hypothetical protein